MKKKLLALLCVLSVLIGVFALSATTATAAEETFQVGYAKVDINPYYMDDEGNIQYYTDAEGKQFARIMPVPMRGTGSSATRLAYEKKMDDNGDGKIDENDGLFLTCIAITDSKDNTVLLFTMDSIGDMGHTTLARAAIESELGIPGDHVMVSGTHAHGGVDLTALTQSLYKDTTADVDVKKADGSIVKVSGRTAFDNLNEWRTRLTGYTKLVKTDTAGKITTFKDEYKNTNSYFVQAAQKALDDRAEATVKKGQIEAVNLDNEQAMNTVRHLVSVDGRKAGGANNVFADKTLAGNKFVNGDNFNLVKSRTGGEFLDQVSDIDRTLHVISFEFKDGNMPIVLANWRCHPSLNSGNVRDNNRTVTSDYINAFRYGLEPEYRVAFFQGAGGNNNPSSKVDDNGDGTIDRDWIVEDEKAKLMGNTYGAALAKVAVKCLAENMSSVKTGEIQTMQNIYNAKSVVYTAAEIAAANAAYEASASTDDEELQAKIAAEIAAVDNETATSTPTLDQLWPKHKKAMNSVYKWDTDPFVYTYTDPDTGETETLCIASETQMSRIRAYSGNTENSTTKMEINTLLIGPEIAIVTCPGEPFDRYSMAAVEEIEAKGGLDALTVEEYTEITNKYNDWVKLNTFDETTGLGIKNAEYGEPLIFGYANQHVTYIPNALAYTYNVTNYSDAENRSYSDYYGFGSYESHMSPLAQGEGEQMVANLADMLNEMVNAEERNCDACGKSVTWYDMSLGIDAGYTHYYLAGDHSIAQTKIAAGKKICLDLRGHELTSTNKRVFYTSDNADVVLNIMDSSGNDSGTIKGIAVNGNSGGTLSFAKGSKINIYSGTLSCNTAGTSANGGVIWSNDEVNIYGGKIVGGKAGSNGDAIYISSNGTLNVHGGTITNGETNDCVAVASGGTVTVGGNAKVDEIRYLTAPTAENFQIVRTADTSVFTGSVVLNANGITHGAIVGSTAVPWEKGASVTVSSGYDVEMNKDGQLVAKTGVAGAAGVVLNKDITPDDITPDDIKPYDTLADAIENVGKGYVILGADVENLTVSSNIKVDLNGHNITNATANEGATLTLMDSKTADYFIGDQVYGIVENVSGNVVAADNYLEIKESVDGEEIRSYHCYKMNLSDVVLRPGRCGMYYKSEFNGDAMVVEQIESFGTALRIGKAPDANSMKPGNYSAFAPEKFGGESNSTILVDILKKANIVSTNQYNAKLKVYGRAYIKLVDGSYLFTDVDEEQAFSLKTLTEKVSKTYSVDVLKENADLMEMYRRFSAVMSDWDIQNIEDAYAANQTEEMETLKILLVGNSHSLDSFHLLYDVIEAEGIPENNKYGAKSVELGVLYYGGCRMRKHAEHAKRNVAAYDYYRVGPSTNGEWVITPETTMKTGLLAEHWDIVVFQEMNMEEGLFVDTATNIAVSSSQYVYDYIRCTLGYTPEFKWNMIWSNPTIPDCCDTTKYTTDAQYKTKWIYKLQTPAYGGFLDGYYSWENRAMAFYKNDPQEQYNKTVKYLQDRIIGYYGITDEDNVVAPGTTVMYAINELNLSGNTGTAVEQRLADEQFSYRDYTHLSDVSRVMVSYLWYAELFGLDKIDSMAYTIVPAAMRAKDQSADVVLDTNMQTNIIKAVNYTLNNRFGMVK